VRREFTTVTISHVTVASEIILIHTSDDPAHTHPFNNQQGNTNLDITETRDSEWQWHQLGHMQVCTSPQTDNHASTPPLSFLQAGCPSCCPTNSVKALKAQMTHHKKVKSETQTQSATNH